MKWIKVVLISAVILLFAAPMVYSLVGRPGRAGSAAPSKDVPWASDYESAVKTVKKTRKPLLVVFYADWCGPCKLMEETTLQDPKVTALMEKFVPVRVDLDQRKDLAQEYMATAIPFTAVVSSEGRMVQSIIGYRSAAEFQDALQKSLSESAAPAPSR